MAQAGGGTVKGKVVNKTVGGDALPAGLTVQLFALSDSGENEGPTATVAADGSFSFGGLAVGDQTTYFALATFLGVTYGTGEVQLTTDKPTAEVELHVYNTTSDGGKIGIARNHLIVDFDSENKLLVIMDVLAVSNKGDRAYIGGERKTQDGLSETLRLRLPTGATHVQFTDGLDEARAKVVDGILIDTAPIAPGGRQIVISYFVPYEPPNAVLLRALDYPVEKVSVVVRDVGAAITVEGLNKPEPLDIGGRRYVQATAENLTPGLSTGIRIGNIPLKVAPEGDAGSQSLPTDRLVLAAGGMGAVALLLGLVYPVLRRRRLVAKADGGAAASSDEWEQLVGEIATLDDDFESGHLAEAEYRQVREEKKARLLRVSRRSGRP